MGWVCLLRCAFYQMRKAGKSCNPLTVSGRPATMTIEHAYRLLTFLQHNLHSLHILWRGCPYFLHNGLIHFRHMKPDMSSETRHIRTLKSLLAFSIIATLIHFTDNYFYFERYPQPDWISQFGVIRTWFLWTAVGLAGTWLYDNRRLILAHLFLLIYAFCGLSSLGHYLYGSMAEFSPKMHFLILADGLAGAGILGFVLWSLIMSPKSRRLTHKSTWRRINRYHRK